jgi:hypothetical protein
MEQSMRRGAARAVCLLPLGLHQTQSRSEHDMTAVAIKRSPVVETLGLPFLSIIPDTSCYRSWLSQ